MWKKLDIKALDAFQTMAHIVVETRTRREVVECW